MAKLALKAAPTFKASVGIPVAGGDPVPVEFTFKHRTRKELDKLNAKLPELSEVEGVMAMVEGWDLEDEFSQDSVAELQENYINSTVAIYNVYYEQLLRAKLKN